MQAIIRTLFAALLALTTVCGCSDKKQVSSPYKVIDSGIWIDPSPEGKVFWLDNERAVFVTYTSLRPGGGAKALTIWTPKTGKIEQPFFATAAYCAQDGIVSFGTLGENGKHQNYRGPLDGLQEDPPPDNSTFDSYFDCNWIPPRAISKPPYFYKLKDDNWLEIIKSDRERSTERGEARYYENRNTPPVSLPIYADVTGKYEIRYNQLRDAYFISPAGYVPDDWYYHSLWWLQRDGTITEEPLPIPLSFVKLIKDLPKGSWYGGMHFYPLRDGYLINSGIGGKRSMTDVGDMGLYLMKNGNIEKLLSGTNGSVNISPDGCWAVFNHARNHQEALSKTPPYNTVKAINLCVGS